MAIKLICAMLLVCSQIAFSEKISRETYVKVIEIGDASGIPRSITRALMHEESGGYAKAVSKKVDGYSSRGLFQLYEKPSNLNWLLSQYWEGGEFDIENPLHNATVGLRYLADLHERFGNWYQALVFYNCGRVVNAPERTRAYALRITSAR